MMRECTARALTVRESRSLRDWQKKRTSLSSFFAARASALPPLLRSALAAASAAALATDTALLLATVTFWRLAMGSAMPGAALIDADAFVTLDRSRCRAAHFAAGQAEQLELATLCSRNFIYYTCRRGAL